MKMSAFFRALAMAALSLLVSLQLNADPVIRGTFLIMTTPYTDDGSVDYDAFVREAEFMDDCGVSGIVYTSDHHLITEEEWKKGLQCIMPAMKGRKAVLTVICNAETTDDVIARCRYAERLAAKEKLQIVLFSRPADNLKTTDELIESLDRIGAAIHTPFIFQTWLSKKLPLIPAPDMAALVRKYPKVFGYVKCEAPGAGSNDYIAAMNAERPDIKSVFSAWGSWQWLYQWRQFHTDGVISQRPAYSDIYSYIWSEMEKGNPDGKADEAFSRVLSMLILRSSINHPDEHRSYHLYALMRRGVFRNMVSRVADKNSARGWRVHRMELTPEQKEEVDIRLEAMVPYMKLPLPDRL